MSESCEELSDMEVETDCCGQGEENCLRVELEIERDGPCVMDDVEGDIVDVEIRFKAGQCRADLGIQNGNGDQTITKGFTSAICDHCTKDIFVKHSCIPRYLEVGDGSFLVETYLPDTDTVSSMVSDLRERSDRVVLRSITSTADTEYPNHCTVDLSSLTPKQRQAVDEARRLGYYDPDSDVELGDVAEQLDISMSALSQRLQRAEANVFDQLPPADSQGTPVSKRS